MPVSCHQVEFLHPILFKIVLGEEGIAVNPGAAQWPPAHR